MTSPFPNFRPTLDDHDLLELVWENGQVLTRGRSGKTQKLRPGGNNGGFFQNLLSKSILDLYETTYGETSKQNTSGGLNKNLEDNHVVPVCENPGSSALLSSSHQSKTGLPEGSDKMKEKLKFPMFFKPLESAFVESAKGSNDIKGHENKHNLQPDQKPVKDSVLDVKDSVPDEQSTAVGRPGGKVFQRSNELRVASSPTCSFEASNYPTYSLRGTYEETEGSTYLSDSLEDETEDVTGCVPARTSKTSKRKRGVEIHDSNETKRREKINKSLRELQELIPHCDKVDQLSIVDETIEYLKTLQLQLQMMSMGNGFVAPPPMMLPFVRYFPMGLGMYTGMHLGSQLLPSPVSATATVPVVDDARHMPRFNDLLVPMSSSSVFASPEGLSAHSVQPPLMSAPAFPMQLQKFASRSNLNDAIYKH